MKRFVGLLALACLAWRASADRVLALVDSAGGQRYGNLFRSLEERNHTVAIRTALDTSPALYDFDTRSFDHLVFLCPSARALGGDISPQRLVEFLDDGGNLFVAVSSSVSEFWRDIAREFDVDFDDRGSAVYDFFSPSTPSSSSDATLLAVPPEPSQETVVVSHAVRQGASVAYRGIGHRRGLNPLLIDVLHAPETAISFDRSQGNDGETFLAGSDIGLVSALQTRTNSRVVFAGSVDMFSDDLYSSDAANGNHAFVDDLFKWAFQERSVLRILGSEHRRPGEPPNPKQYRITNEIEYRVSIQALDAGVWGPLPLPDLQLEFTMLDPHLRIPLPPAGRQASPDRTEFATTFVAPDRHGVFTFKLDHRRPGWTFLKDDKRVAVTPPRHDEYPRFIGGAMPYYVGTASTVVGFALFVVVWILHVPSR